MKRVLFIVGDFWPTKSGGTIRVEKLLKYFPSNEIKSIVLSRKLTGMSKTETRDNVLIFRTNALDVGGFYQKIKKIFKINNTKKNKASANEVANQKNERIGNYFFIPDVDIFWAIASILKLFTIVKKEQIDIIYSSSPCSSVHIPALIYKMLFGKSKKWIVEFRDPWTFNPFRNPKPYLLEILDHKLEKLVIKKSDKIIVTSDQYKYQFLKKYQFLQSDKISFIPNGYDSDDFADIEKPFKKNNDKVTIIHTGNFYGKRSLKPFLQALYSIYKKFPKVDEKIEFIQYGNIDPESLAYNELNFNPLIKHSDTIPHKLSLVQMMNADWLLLIPGPGEGTMPGKLYEYIATGNPIIAIVDEGPAKGLIEELGLGCVIATTDIKKIEYFLLKIINKELIYDYSINKDIISKYDRKNIASSVCAILINS